MRTDVVRARVSHETKMAAEKILKKVGLTMSEAINLTLVQIKLRKGLPFEVSAEPNKETVRAIKEAQAGIGVKTYGSVDEFFETLGKKTHARSTSKK